MDAQQHIAAIRAALEMISTAGSLRSLFEERRTLIDACHPDAMRDILAYIAALEADAEAFRTMVRLHLTVRCYMGNVCAQRGVPGEPSVYVDETNTNDPLMAARTAISRAAIDAARKGAK